MDRQGPWKAVDCTRILRGRSAILIAVITVLLSSGGFALISTAPAAAQSDPGAFGQINSVACTDSLHCWIVGQTGTIGQPVGQSLILATTDGGASWMSQTVPAGLSGYQFDHIFCLPNTQYDCWIAADLSGEVLATTDGTSWQAYQVPGASDIAGIACADPLHCWASDGRAGGVYGSTDGGQTWTQQVSDLGFGMPAVACGDDTHCWAFGGDGSGNAVILATQDGSTWSSQSPPAGVLKLDSAACVSDLQCWASGGNPGTIVATSDGGNTWTTQLMTSSAMGDNFFEGISCLSSTYCWAVGGKFTDEAYDGANNGYVYRWDGTSWTPAEVPATASVFSVSGIACPTMATCLATGYYANGAAVIDYGVSNGGTATAGVDQVSLTASGGTDNVDSVSEAQYGPDPVGALTDGTSFFDMALSSGNTFNNVVLEDCNDVTSSSTLDWWNPSANSGGGGWVEIVGDPGPTYIAGSPSCIMLTLDNSTTPSISQLNGSVVGVVGGGTPPPHKDAITSANTKMASAGRFFSFPVTTSGTPSPKLRERGKLPRGVKFHKGTGSAELSGTPQSTKHRSADGTYRLTFTATFGKGKTKVVVTQSFTLTVS